MPTAVGVTTSTEFIKQDIEVFSEVKSIVTTNPT